MRRAALRICKAYLSDQISAPVIEHREALWCRGNQADWSLAHRPFCAMPYCFKPGRHIPSSKSRDGILCDHYRLIVQRSIIVHHPLYLHWLLSKGSPRQGLNYCWIFNEKVEDPTRAGTIRCSIQSRQLMLTIRKVYFSDQITAPVIGTSRSSVVSR